MYLHKEDKELFKDVLNLVSERKNLPVDIVEKDYYVTMILKLLSIKYPEVVFKGGTSLSEAHKIINRFSEDIDITFKEHLGESRRKKLKYNILKPISKELDLEIKNWNQIESDKDYNHYDYEYHSILSDDSINRLPSYVKLETALMSYSFPTEVKEIENYIYEVLKEDEIDLLVKYDLMPFEMNVQCINRTLADKIYAIADYYLLGRDKRNSRHLYDVYKLAKEVNIDKSFIELMSKVRDHRKTLGKDVAPSADDSIHLIEVAKKIKEDKYYEEDYHRTTEHIIAEKLSYEKAIDNYVSIVKKISK